MIDDAGQNDFIGEFPRKGVILHHHFAKLHLHSHVFRGLKNTPIPPYFHENAVAAVSAATSIVESLLTDPDLRDGLVGIPHYLHTMTAFACVFLLKVASQHSGQFIEDAMVLDLTTRLVHQFRITVVGKWHLVHLMADGLEKMAAKKITSPPAFPHPPLPNGNTPAAMAYLNGTGNTFADGFPNGTNNFYGQMPSNNDGEMAFVATPFVHFDSGNFDLHYSGFGVL